MLACVWSVTDEELGECFLSHACGEGDAAPFKHFIRRLRKRLFKRKRTQLNRSKYVQHLRSRSPRRRQQQRLQVHPQRQRARLHPGRIVDAANGGRRFWRTPARTTARTARPSSGSRASTSSRRRGWASRSLIRTSTPLRSLTCLQGAGPRRGDEDSLRDSLYVKPQKPKGNTAGRARTQSYAGALMQA